jgi:NAD-dependent deacetylase
VIYEIVKPIFFEQIRNVQEEVGKAVCMTAITGAGLSVASGLPVESATVRGVPLKRFFDRKFWLTAPESYFELYRNICEEWRGALPNQGHRVLARAGIRIITQNIDGLHRDAGTDYLLELHGNLRELRCDSCHSIFDSGGVLKSSVPVPTCSGCGAVLRPGITFEGEQVRHASMAFDWVGSSDLLLIVGTTLHMSPLHVAHRIASENGATVVWINTDADVILPEIFASIPIKSEKFGEN